ncbi:MAG: DUF3987 domain-containing protein [Alphaproteobacteria bacterium]|nr:DUF3987 domain-containing protein [Alphaproteobacteria bacterium]MBT4085813.1 DUF3987 domain-containing protein [Alphaproteobacteria bacterium]MBT4544222.1 DUF3987 domain-containing protein [Alphaproteobacteria bacterium]MBT7744444.1 DUF3987 domain-containing protein [Alphaproteobacteria bacterium]
MTIEQQSARGAVKQSTFSKFGPEVRALGYTTVAVKGKSPFEKGWQNRQPKPDDFDPGKYGPDTNLGIRLGGNHNVVVVDIDALDEDTARFIVNKAKTELGDGPERIGQPPKSAIFLRCSDSQLFRKIKTAKYKINGKKNQVEILGEGQMAVASGTHPDTCKKYTYPNDKLIDYRPEELPEVSGNELRQFIQECDRYLASHGELVSASNSAASAGGKRRSGLDLFEQLADIEEVKAAAANVTEVDDYDDFIGAILEVSGATNGSDEGRKLAHQMASLSDKYEIAETEAKYDSANPDFVGAPSLFKRAARDSGGKWTIEKFRAKQTATAFVDSEPDLAIIKPQKTPPEFPISHFGSWGEWITTTAESRGAPVDYVAVALLAEVAAIIGNSRRASPWEGWIEATIIWAGLIGNPSSNKSPALAAVRELADVLEDEMGIDYPEKKREWETETETARQNRIVWEKDIKDAVQNSAGTQLLPENAVPPDRPVRPRITVSDATTESIAELLTQHQRGLLLVRDELAGFLENFERYNPGSDRPFYNEAYNGQPYTVDRKKNDEPMLVPYLSVGLVGSIQPDKVAQLLLKGADDGLTSRVLMTWPESIPPRQPIGKPDNNMALSALRRLLKLKMTVNDSGKSAPVIVTLDRKAVEHLNRWRSKNSGQQKWASGLYLSHLGKMPGVTLRLALILEFMDWAWLPDTTEEPSHISARSFAKAVALVDDYFLPMAERAYGDAALPPDQRNAAVLAKRILLEKATTINCRAIQRDWKLPGLDTAGAIKKVIDDLVEANWLTPVPSREGAGAGRQKSNYQVNQKVMELLS